MKKILLTESEKKAIILKREMDIINYFRKTYNSIKRVDENELDPHDVESRSVEYGVNPYSKDEEETETDEKAEETKKDKK